MTSAEWHSGEIREKKTLDYCKKKSTGTSPFYSLITTNSVLCFHLSIKGIFNFKKMETSNASYGDGTHSRKIIMAIFLVAICAIDL